MAMTTSSDMEGSWRIALSLCLSFCFSMASLQEKGVSGVEKDVLASGRNACYKVIWIPYTTLFFYLFVWSAILPSSPTSTTITNHQFHGQFYWPIFAFKISSSSFICLGIIRVHKGLKLEATRKRESSFIAGVRWKAVFVSLLFFLNFLLL